MSAPVFVAYDGSSNADDAVALGQLLARLTGSDLALAHVYRAAPRRARSAPATAEARDRFLTRRGEQLLEHASARARVDARRVVVGATTTATGMRTLAEREGAVAVVFGSAANTEPGHVHPGSASRRLLQGAPCAVAFAPVGYRASANALPARIGFVFDDEDGSARRSAEALAGAIGSGASVAPGDEGPLVGGGEGPVASGGKGPVVGGGERPVVGGGEGAVDVLVIGSRPGAEGGRVMIGANAQAPLHAATSPVVVVPRGVVLPSAAELASVA